MLQNLCVSHEGKHSLRLLNENKIAPGAKIHVLLAPKITSQYRNTSYLRRILKNSIIWKAHPKKRSYIQLVRAEVRKNTDNR